MKTKNITLRIDEDIKEKADALFKELGMSINTAFNLFLKQSIRNQAFPFPITKKAQEIAMIENDDTELDLTETFKSLQAMKKKSK